MPNSKNSVLYQSYPAETPIVDVSNYFEEFASALHPVGQVRGKLVVGQKSLETAFYQEALGLTREEIQELEEATSVDKLICPGEIEPFEHKLHESDADFNMKYEMALSKCEIHDLETVKHRMEEDTDLYSYYNLKYGHYVWLKSQPFIDIKRDLDPFNFSTVVFCVKVYYPYFSSSNQPFRIKLLQEIHILGDQFLSQLKDEICCTMDYSGITDVSDSVFTRTRRADIKKREDYQASFIFIENKFYNDTRSDSKKDISKTILEWAKNKEIGPFTVGSMENTKMIDLKVKLGHPYVYQHQGDCEHIVFISDIRYLQVDDPHKKCNFPRIYAKGRCSGKYCMMCGVSFAMWLVTGNSRLTHDKTYFCTRCFFSYNYVDKQKVGNFKAFEYVDPIALL